MKKVMLVVIGSFILPSAYAINLPSQTTDSNTIRTSASFVNKSKAPLPVCPQRTLISVKKELVQQIVNRDVKESNANEIEQLLGPACSCVPSNPPALDVWICQWKGDLASNRVENTVNITFEAGMLINVTAMTDDDVVYTAEPNTKVKVLTAQ